MTSNLFFYNKPKVIQALRFHFMGRPEIKILMVLVNIFAIASAALFFFEKISPLAFLISSFLWFFLMILFWFVLPQIIYKQSTTFKDSIRAVLGKEQFAIENATAHKGWDWNSFSTWMESPHFFHLYFNPRSFFIVPKDAFEGDNEHEARRIFSEKIKK
ncbi:MAG: YcxB family protein [Ferruginibacter sp.]|nr:YcxB family protein [Ferruginibacter sp.]